MKLKFFIIVSVFSAFVANSQNYWQQEVNYTIQVKLDDQNHTLSAYEEFEYINHSPNSLDKIYIHLWPNAYRNGKSALAKQQYAEGKQILRFGEEKDKGGIDSLDFKVNGQQVKWSYDFVNPDICVIMLPNTLKSGERIRISTPFKVKIPSGEISRLGHIGQSYQITQWYPKPAVYDKNGWNPIPYLNQGEFYSEFGSFDVTITLPSNYVVGATGDLQTSSEIDFLNGKASETELKLADYLMAPQGRNGKTEFPESSKEWKTIHYKQSKVHDFAWFADKRYAVLKGEVELPHSKRKVTSWAMFVPHNTIHWQHAIEYINDGTYHYSLWNGDYPYNQVTAVDGTISAGGGMEYPNVTVIGNSSSKEELEIVIVHEVGHNWFYGILGSNERVHGWMDEGMNTLNEMRYMTTKYPNNKNMSDMIFQGRLHFNDLSHHDMGDISSRFLAVIGEDQPIETHSADFTSANYGVTMYQKTGLVFFYLKDYLGEELFNKAMSNYFEEWKFKHPQPEDMKKSIETTTGKDLSWLFGDLIQTTRHIDYKIKKVKKDKLTNTTRVTVKNVGQVQGPIEINAFMDSKEQNNKLIETKWVEPSKKSEVVLNGTDFTKITIDDSKDIPEVNRGNNVWTAHKLVHKIEPLKTEFLIGDHEYGKTNLFWLPTISGNSYDKLMMGVAVHNFGIPFKPFQFLIAPQFSFGRKNIAGIAELSYSFLPVKGIKLSKFGLSVKNFGNGENRDGFLLAVSPYWNAKLGNRGRAKATSHNLLVQAIYRKDRFSTYDFNQRGAFAQYDYNVDLPDQKFNMRLRLDYMQSEDNQDQLGRFSTSASYKYRYLKNDMNRWVELKAYFGTNFLYESADGVGNTAYQMSLSGARGYQDLFLEDYDFARNNTSGFWNQQRAENFGGFRSTSSFGTTSFWMATTNTYVQLPIKPNVFGLFGDFGSFYGGSSVQTAWNTGVGIRFSSVLGIYLPLLRSENMGPSIYENYWQNIRFSLRLNIVNKGLKISNLL
jgi:hypothetical protein